MNPQDLGCHMHNICFTNFLDHFLQQTINVFVVFDLVGCINGLEEYCASFRIYHEINDVQFRGAGPSITHNCAPIGISFLLLEVHIIVDVFILYIQVFVFDFI